MENLTTAVGNVLTLAGTVLTEIVGNPYLAIPFACAIVGSLIGVVRRLRRV